MQRNVVASAGTGGVEHGFIKLLGYSITGVSTKNSSLFLANHVNSSRKTSNWSIFGMGGVGVDKLFFLL